MVLRKRLQPYHILWLLPFFSVIVFCARYNQNVWQVYLPNSQWNDEVIYYKIIEGIKSYGIPQGYFGYNESHALVGSFGAWSPAVYIFDVICASIFGWNYYMPILARIVFSIVSFGIYAGCKKPSFKECMYIYLYIASFTLFTRYMISQMADCYLTGLMILFLAVDYKRVTENKRKWDILEEIIIVFLTLVRPYFAILWGVVLAGDKNKKVACKHIIIGILGFFFSLILLHYYTSAYFVPLIKTDWIKLIIENPALGLKNTIESIGTAAAKIYEYIRKAFLFGDYVGLHYFIYILITMMLMALAIMEKRKRWLAWGSLNVVFIFSLILLYDVEVGSRHLMPFIISEGVLLLGALKQKWRLFLISIVCFLCLFMYDESYYIKLPTYDEHTEKVLATMEECLKDQMIVDVDDDKWENTVIWVLYDSDGVYPWETLYSLPAGMGINICSLEYVTENISNISAKYIACTSEGMVSALCRYQGYDELLRMNDEKICIYRR